MKILIVAATEFEIRPLLNRMNRVKVHSDMLTCYTFLGHEIDVLVPGIGMLVTAFHMGRQLMSVQYDLALNAGIAGTYGRGTSVGDVVEVTEETMSELGAEEGEKVVSVFELGLMDPDSFPFKNGLLVNENRVKVPTLENMKKVRGNTVSLIRGSKEGIMEVRKFADADIESMEGAAFFYSCLSAGIPFAQVRSVSNNVEERDKSAWDIPQALKRLNHALKTTIEELPRTGI